MATRTTPTRLRERAPGAPTTPATTNSGGTPGLKGAKPGTAAARRAGRRQRAANKKRRIDGAPGRLRSGTAGTIKNSAYVLLAQSGVAGMTVAAIVEAATKQGYVGSRHSCLSAFLSFPETSARRSARARSRVRSNRSFSMSHRTLLPPFVFLFSVAASRCLPSISRREADSLSPRLFPKNPCEPHRLYSWGTCKTPNNSVTAALSQDTTFVRIAPPRTRCGTLRRGAGPVPQPRTSSGSINSGLGRAAAAAA